MNEQENEAFQKYLVERQRHLEEMRKQNVVLQFYDYHIDKFKKAIDLLIIKIKKYFYN